MIEMAITLRSETAKGTIPAATSGSGTITSEATDRSVIVSSSAHGLSKYKKNQWIYIPSTEELVRVIEVMSTTMFRVSEDIIIAAVAYDIVDANLTSCVITPDGTNPADIDGVTIAAAADVVFNGRSLPQGGAEYLPAIKFDASGGTIEIKELS